VASPGSRWGTRSRRRVCAEPPTRKLADLEERVGTQQIVCRLCRMSQKKNVTRPPMTPGEGPFFSLNSPVNVVIVILICCLFERLNFFLSKSFESYFVVKTSIVFQIQTLALFKKKPHKLANMLQILFFTFSLIKERNLLRRSFRKITPYVKRRK
jgi:hypothetical protein